jgi:preprotein translocase subunit YajC
MPDNFGEMHSVTTSMLFLSALPAAQAGQPAASPHQFLVQFVVPLGLMFAIWYLLFIRPQSKKAQEHRDMLSKLRAGDRIVTTGGIHGTVSQVREKTVMLTVAEKVDIEISRAAVSAVESRKADT